MRSKLFIRLAVRTLKRPFDTLASLTGHCRIDALWGKKSPAGLISLSVLFTASLIAQQDATSATDSHYSIVQSGPHSRVWQSVSAQKNLSGTLVYRTNTYDEMATGLNHLVGKQWVESSETVKITQDGGAATGGQHQAYFAANINTLGGIHLVTPDSLDMRSHIMGLGYYDSSSGQSVLIAELQDSTGQVLPSLNAVIYTNAFTDFEADVIYTYTKGGLEQDIVLRQQPPSPSSFNFNPQTTTLQVWTEFIQAPAPSVTTQTVRGGYRDDYLDFGIMKMEQGTAFVLADHSSLEPVFKHWQVYPDQGRTFLVEEVPLPSIAMQLENLPAPSAPGSGNPQDGGHALLNHVSKYPVLLAKKGIRKGTAPMRMASTKPNPKGLVLDYMLVSSQANFTAQSDTTYYISGAVTLTGVTTVEGGTVIKFANSVSAKISLTNLLCLTSPYRPAVFTSKNDDTQGEVIAGSTGTPSNTGATYLNVTGTSNTNVYKYLRFLYAGTAVSSPPLANGIWHSQFVKCGNAFYCTVDIPLWLHNVLFAGCTTNINNNNDNVFGENITIDGGAFKLGSGAFTFTNSVITGVTFDTACHFTSCYTNTTSAGLYQVVGGAGYYLTNNSPYRNVGTTNINANLLADLALKTTYPPFVFAYQSLTNNLTLSPQAGRDNGTNLDLGYHYEPIDFAFGAVEIGSNVVITVTPGTAMAGFNTNAVGYALLVGPAGQLSCQGSPTSLIHFVHFNTVQELSANKWIRLTNSGGGLLLPNFVNSSPCVINFQFTDFSILTQDTFSINGTSAGTLPINLQDCQLHGGILSLQSGAPVNLTNCLLERVNSTIYGFGTQKLFIRNNLIWGGYFEFYSETNASLLQDNMFYKTAIMDDTAVAYVFGYNGFYSTTNIFLRLTNSTDAFLTTDPGYIAGPLGNYYLPIGNTTLINKGNTTANLLGLYHYATTTNEVKETNSTVDIGYHYVAVNGNNQAVDTDGDGLPDYWEDANGTGVTDSGETDWHDPNDLGLFVIITRPKNNSLIP